MSRVRTHATASSIDNIRISAVDVAVLRAIEPCWDALPDSAKARTVEDAAATGIGQSEATHNTTCIELDEYRVQNLDPAQSRNFNADVLALGTNDDPVGHGDRELRNEHVRTDLTESVANGNSLDLRFFLAQSEGNGADGSAVTLTELGVYAGPHFLNHSVFASVDKSDQKAVTFTVTLTFNTA